MVNGSGDKAKLDFIEYVYPENVGNKKILSLAPQMADIEMASLVVKRPRSTRSNVHVTKLILI